jgi:hypothetical protein
MTDAKTEAYKLINETPINHLPDDKLGYAGLRQIEDTITLLEVVINDILDSSESILFYNQVLKQIQSRYEILLAQTAHYKPQI